jgi:transcriptional regulator with XRE-family HTH domain
MKTRTPPSFARALRAVRKARAITQEEFDPASGRTYVSTMERGLKVPTISKVVELAGVCGVHPLTLLALSFCRTGKRAELEQLVATMRSDLDSLGPLDL